MQFNKYIKRLFCCLLILSISNIYAHPGGHYHKKDGTVFNIWQLKTGEQIKGNFSMGNSQYIVLEQEEGKLVKLPISDLSEQDQKLARFKAKRFERLNEEYNAQAKIPLVEKNNFSYSMLILTFLLTLFAILILKQLISFYKKLPYNKTKVAVMACSLSLLLIIMYACKKSVDNIITTPTIPKTSTGFIDSAFAPYKPAVSTNWDANYFYVSSNGMPAHNMMVGITSWQQQVPIPQPYTGSNSWSIPLQPVYADIPLSTKTNLMKGAVAIAVNGIPIFNAFNNRGVDSYATGELDNWGGHCGRADDYHYHAAPLHLSATSGLKAIAFGLDGFPVYGTQEPDGSPMQVLDTCHGHIYNNGLYHYHGTTTYPYVIGAMKGKVSLDINTLAPENQILPQAFASPVRPATSPLNGATITDFVSTGTNAYKLTYKIGSQFGYVEYSWDATNKYTYKLTDINGNVTTTVYQR